MLTFDVDVDEILDDVRRGRRRDQEGDSEDLPAGGAFFCVQCDRFFVSLDALTKHGASKVHRKRLKQLAEQERYEQSEAAARRVDNGPPLRRSTMQWIEQVRVERAAAEAAAASTTTTTME